MTTPDSRLGVLLRTKEWNCLPNRKTTTVCSSFVIASRRFAPARGNIVDRPTCTLFDGMLSLVTTVLDTSALAQPPIASLQLAVWFLSLFFCIFFLEESNQICGKATMRMETGL
uniref:Uncharacterized protein n=1 Tax=Anopheles funestus TaxID=62324 RepID=A0A4Y0BIL6_ANOFN